jgi:hypothetical protein
MAPDLWDSQEGFRLHEESVCLIKGKDTDIIETGGGALALAFYWCVGMSHHSDFLNLSHLCHL